MMKKIVSVLTASVIAVSMLAGCSFEKNNDSSVKIKLSDNKITVDRKNVGPDSSQAVYLSNDISYYENKDTYESGNKYGEGTEDEKHTAEQAKENTVVNITKAGTYRISGVLSKGQIRVDLGENAKTDESAVVTLILDGVDISCDVAPAILFNNVYECDKDASVDTASSEVDTSAAGANIVIADSSVNNVNGSHVAKKFKDTDEEKKLLKQDGAVYSYMSMNIGSETEQSTGTLNVVADNEGIDTELHLTINGGNINIQSADDGINTNEDGVSVTTVNSGNLHIVAGLGKEGDGIDSNGWLVINGGTVVASANPASDAGLDSDMGSYINGGTVVALGSTMDWAESDSKQVTMNLQFSEYNNTNDAIAVTDKDSKVIFAYNPSDDELLGSNTRKYMGAVISSPSFEKGKTYSVYIGGTLNGTDNMGVYSEITAYNDGVKQSFTGTDVRGAFGAAGPQGNMPEGEKPSGEIPQKPENDGKLNMNGDNKTPPELPSEADKNGSDVPENPAAEGNNQPPKPPEGGQQTESDAEASEEFYMQDMVNFFSGVSASNQ